MNIGLNYTFGFLNIFILVFNFFEVTNIIRHFTYLCKFYVRICKKIPMFPSLVDE